MLSRSSFHVCPSFASACPGTRKDVINNKASRARSLANGLRLRMNPQENFEIEDLSVYEVKSAEDAKRIYSQGI